MKTAAFSKVCCDLAHDMLSAGLSWEDVDTKLRYTATVAIMPRRSYSSDEISDFYVMNFRVIDGAWLPAVLALKREYMAMQKDPAGWLVAHKLLPSVGAFVK